MDFHHQHDETDRLIRLAYLTGGILGVLIIAAAILLSIYLP